MKYSDIDFETIKELSEQVELMRELLEEDYHTLQKTYLRLDGRIIRCFKEHRTLDSDLRKLDFVRLSTVCFSNKSYISRRLNKMSKGFKVLLELERI